MSKCSMLRHPFLLLFSSISMVLAIAAECRANDSKVLWQIGIDDGKGDEFALAPGDYSQFREDGCFLVGVSDPRRDWPYVHPGLADTWAGGREHTFNVAFYLKPPIPSGNCRLKIALVDKHDESPMVLDIKINDRTFDPKLPAGGSEASINGRYENAKSHRLDIVFPANILKAGLNEIAITTTHRSSWMLYDWLGLETPTGVTLDEPPLTSVVVAQPTQALIKKDNQLLQPIEISIAHFAAKTNATVRLGETVVPVTLDRGRRDLEIAVPEVKQETSATVVVQAAGKTLAERSFVLKPVGKRTIYVLPHSHTDLGYTDLEPAIEKQQVDYLLKGIEYAKKTADYPDGARFVWNVEVVWVADLYMHRLSPAQQQDFLNAVKKGQVALNGMYLNTLTGLCRPEELLQLFRCSTKLADECSVPIDSAMISDVPGYAWGIVPAMAQAGIKYFSVGSNFADRVGDIRVQWEDKPFYWVSPSGKEKVLVMFSHDGYAVEHVLGELSPQFVKEYQEYLDKIDYPYEIDYLRWSGDADNAPPSAAVCDFVKDWNAKYVWPKYQISSTSTAFRAFEERYGDKLPRMRGDLTPYWEDGAGSSANETALNRDSSDRLAQAQTLWAMLDPAAYPTTAFEEAWQSVLLYSEHTWGAANSIREPDSKETKEQWAIKQSFALRADKQSRNLLAQALEKSGKPGSASAIEVFNTTSWPRTELVVLSSVLSAAGDRVTDSGGQPVPSQRLSTGELAFLAVKVPPFAARRYQIAKGEPFAESKVTASETTLDNGLLMIGVSAKTGGIVDLRAKGIEGNLVDTVSGNAINDYLYLIGDNPARIQRNGPVKISIKEKGPLVASLLIESEAPGCKKLSREVRLLAGSDYAELINTVDKIRLAARNYIAKQGKESVNFAFPFKVPEGEMLLDVPFGAFQPERDQLPGACKNWLTVGRWADVSNSKQGVTWITLDAPLVELGGITATILDAHRDPKTWQKKIEPTQTLYSWVMNNHWYTNYCAYQEGPTTFRFVVRPHRSFNPAEATRLATGLSQPLIVAPAKDSPRSEIPLLDLGSDDVTVTALKPSDDGKAWIVRLFGASGKHSHVNIAWAAPAPNQIFLSDTSEKPRQKIEGPIDVPGWGIVTLRAERP
jgi:alpha-mannosidase